MLMFLRPRGSCSKGNRRKFRLFACACCRLFWKKIKHPDSRRAVEVAERYAEGDATVAELSAARRATEAVAKKHFSTDAWYPAKAAEYPALLGAWDAAKCTAGAVLLCDLEQPHREQSEAQAALLRDIIGNPFQRLPPRKGRRLWDEKMNRWRTGNKGTVTKLAQAIYDDRAFDRLPILADALEDASCDDAEILAHCRGPGPHARGCWVVDLLLGKQ
jgi:hypothetical protein